jgi:hypothetical protein
MINPQKNSKLCYSRRSKRYSTYVLSRRHNEYFKYIYDLLREKKHPQIKIFGDEGVILPEENKD